MPKHDLARFALVGEPADVFTLAEFIESNPDLDSDALDQIAALAIGERVTIDNGACGAFTIERVGAVAPGGPSELTDHGVLMLAAEAAIAGDREALDLVAEHIGRHLDDMRGRVDVDVRAARGGFSIDVTDDGRILHYRRAGQSSPHLDLAVLVARAHAEDEPDGITYLHESASPRRPLAAPASDWRVAADEPSRYEAGRRVVTLAGLRGLRARLYLGVGRVILRFRHEFPGHAASEAARFAAHVLEINGEAEAGNTDLEVELVGVDLPSGVVGVVGPAAVAAVAAYFGDVVIESMIAGAAASVAKLAGES